MDWGKGNSLSDACKEMSNGSVHSTNAALLKDVSCPTSTGQPRCSTAQVSKRKQNQVFWELRMIRSELFLHLFMFHEIHIRELHLSFPRISLSGFSCVIINESARQVSKAFVGDPTAGSNRHPSREPCFTHCQLWLHLKGKTDRENSSQEHLDEPHEKS